MAKINIQRAMPNRFAQCTQGRQSANLFAEIIGIDGSNPVVSDGMRIAILESTGREFKTKFEALTAEQFSIRSAANPHLHMTAWFFKRDGAKWSFVGFGRSENDFQESGFARP